MPVSLNAPFTVWIQPTKRSNLNSILAYDIPDPSQKELSYEEIAKLLKELFEKNIISIFFEGGEPFLRSDFLDLVRLATPNAFTIVRTNGTLIDMAIAKQIKDIKVAVVCVDVEGAIAETHDSLTGVPGSFDRTMAGVRALTRAGVSTYLTCVLNRRNASELQQLLDLAADSGAEKVGVLRLYALGAARLHWDELSLSLDDQMSALANLQPPPGVQLMQSWHPNDPNCCWQTGAVDAYGRSIGCPYLRDYVNYGSIRSESFFDTWKHPLYTTIRQAEVKSSCGQCAANDKNRTGGCRSSAYAFSGRWDAPDPYCTEMNQKRIDLTKLPDWLAKAPPGATPQPIPSATAGS